LRRRPSGLLFQNGPACAINSAFWLADLSADVKLRYFYTGKTRKFTAKAVFYRKKPPLIGDQGEGDKKNLTKIQLIPAYEGEFAGLIESHRSRHRWEVQSYTRREAERHFIIK